MSGFRLIFMGTPDFSVPALKNLINSKHSVVAVFTQPPKPKGRGYEVQESPIHLVAKSAGIPVETPKSLKNYPLESLKKYQADVAVVAAYGLILPKAVLEIPRLGCINIHASLLPRWRGAAPIQRAIEAGDTESGVTIMQMDEGLDTGDMLLMKRCPVLSATTGQSLHDEISSLGSEAILEALDFLEQGKITPQAQPLEGITYAHKLQKEEGRLDWAQDARILERKIRAFYPWPGTFFKSANETVKVLEAQYVDASGTPGQILDDQLTVACGHGALRILKLQKAGKSAMNAKDFLNGIRLVPGTHLE